MCSIVCGKRLLYYGGDRVSGFQGFWDLQGVAFSPKCGHIFDRSAGRCVEGTPGPQSRTKMCPLHAWTHLIIIQTADRCFWVQTKGSVDPPVNRSRSSKGATVVGGVREAPVCRGGWRDANEHRRLAHAPSSSTSSVTAAHAKVTHWLLLTFVMSQCFIVVLQFKDILASAMNHGILHNIEFPATRFLCNYRQVGLG